MAVRSSEIGSTPASVPPSAPIRTCVGCRRRDVQTALLRVVAGAGLAESPSGWALVPDPRRQHPGRGAYLHPSLECYDQAITRRAFGRALRRAGQPDAGAVRAEIQQSKQ